MTSGVDDITLDGINIDYIKRIQNEIKNGTYEFSPARRIQIPKPGKKETRPLNIASPREKLVQKAILQVLERHYETKFLESSHGFRPKRGTHTAMKHLEAKFQSAHYIIEADFTKAFDTIQHSALMKILKEDISCTKTLKLISSSLKAGYVEFGNLHNNLPPKGEMGTPQGSILSPLLCNIYLHKLDLYVEKLKTEYQAGTRRLRNPDYEKVQNKVKYWKKKKYDNERSEEFSALLKELRSIPSCRRDDSYVRINYVRYADDFIIGVEGSYKIAQEILTKVSQFVNEELKLTFNPDKTGITKYSEKHVRFLGFNVRAPHLKGISKPLETINVGDRNILRRKKIRIRISMDLEKVLKRLQSNRFIRKRTSHKNHDQLMYRGTFKGNLINLDHPDIINYYNSVVRGIFNYYSFASNRTDIA